MTGENMAPIFAAAVGINPQIIDDERLRQLMKSLSTVKLQVPLHRTYTSPEEVETPLDIDHLVTLLEPWKTWLFEEQVGQSATHPSNGIFSLLNRASARNQVD